MISCICMLKQTSLHFFIDPTQNRKKLKKNSITLTSYVLLLWLPASFCAIWRHSNSFWTSDMNSTSKIMSHLISNADFCHGKMRFCRDIKGVRLRFMKKMKVKIMTVISYLHGSCYLSKKGPASVSYRSPRVRGRHVIVAFLINTSVSLCKVESAQCAFGKRQVWVFDVANWCLPLPIDIRLLLIDIWRFYLSPMY